MTDIMELVKELYTRVEWQKTPGAVYKEDLAELIAAAIKDLFIMTGRTMQHSEDMWVYDEISEDFKVPVFFDADLLLDEREYVLVCAQIAFFTKVRTDVNNIVGYSTDALTITHGDKPYAYLTGTINELETRRRSLWFKMSRYTI